MSEQSLHLRLDGFEGPLDLLLELARGQKLDLGRSRSSRSWTSIWR
jgi:segregation and condensation protein A